MKVIWKFPVYEVKYFKFGSSLTEQNMKGYKPDIIELTEKELKSLAIYGKDYELYLRKNLLAALSTNGRLIIKKENKND